MIVVTGADGFAGSHLVDYLLTQGKQVRALVRSTPLKNLVRQPNLEIVQADLLDLKSLQVALADCDQVFHLAAVSGVEETRRMPEQAWETNTRGTLNVLRAALDNSVRKVLVTSTCHIVGHDIYAASKRATEEICNVYSKDLDIVITRAYNHFGPRQRPEWLIPKIILQALNGRRIELGNPNPRRDYTYVSDIVRGYALAMDEGKGTYTLCSGVMRSVKQVADEICNLMGFQGIVMYGEYRGQDFTLHASDFDKARQELDWFPMITFTDGLERTIAWYRNQSRKS